MEGRYSIELCNEGSPACGIEAVLALEEGLITARTLYQVVASQYPDRVILLCDRALVLARSDMLDTMPS